MPKGDRNKHIVRDVSDLEDIEREILKDISVGLTDEEIAEGNGLETEKVKEMIAAIRTKLGNLNRVQMAVWHVKKTLGSGGRI